MDSQGGEDLEKEGKVRKVKEEVKKKNQLHTADWGKKKKKCNEKAGLLKKRGSEKRGKRRGN